LEGQEGTTDLVSLTKNLWKLNINEAKNISMASKKPRTSSVSCKGKTAERHGSKKHSRTGEKFEGGKTLFLGFAGCARMALERPIVVMIDANKPVRGGGRTCRYRWGSAAQKPLGDCRVDYTERGESARREVFKEAASTADEGKVLMESHSKVPGTP